MDWKCFRLTNDVCIYSLFGMVFLKDFYRKLEYTLLTMQLDIGPSPQVAKNFRHFCPQSCNQGAEHFMYLARSNHLGWKSWFSLLYLVVVSLWMWVIDNQQSHGKKTWSRRHLVYRKMLRLSWLQKVTNKVVLEEMKVKSELLNIIRARQWSFVGYLLRENDGMERHIIETETVGKRARGRHSMRMFDWMTTRSNVCNAKDLGNIARDKEKWRKSKPCFVNGWWCHGTRRRKSPSYTARRSAMRRKWEHSYQSLELVLVMQEWLKLKLYCVCNARKRKTDFHCILLKSRIAVRLAAARLSVMWWPHSSCSKAERQIQHWCPTNFSWKPIADRKPYSI